MTSESCLCLYFPLPSDAGLYTESGLEQERERRGLNRGVRPVREDKVDWLKKKRRRTSDKIRETEIEKSQQNRMSSLC